MRRTSNAKKLARGVLIVFEGIDGSGKTTQAGRLCDFLRREGYDACRLSEPTDGVWGARIRKAASEKIEHESPEEEYRLFVLDRKQNVKDNLLPSLAARRIVILDRYYFSTMAYQGARGIDPERIRRENEVFAPVPDLVLFISIPVETGISRIGKNRGAFTSFERDEYLIRVKAIFDEYVAYLPFVMMVDGARNEDVVFDEIKKRVMTLIEGLS